MEATETYAPTGSDGGADDAAAGGSTSLPGLPAYDYYGREITDPALSDCAVPNSPEMAERWIYDQLDAWHMALGNELVEVTRANVSSVVAYLLRGLEMRSA